VIGREDRVRNCFNGGFIGRVGVVEGEDMGWSGNGDIADALLSL
jgi:hypothetical protein